MTEDGYGVEGLAYRHVLGEVVVEEHVVMVERFTEGVCRIMHLANSEARRLNHEYIGPEHVLPALLKLGNGMAVITLRQLDVDVREVRLELENTMEIGPNRVLTGKLPQTFDGK